MHDDAFLQQWRTTAEYLTQEIPGYSFEITPLSSDEMLIAVDNGDVDFVVCNPALYVELEFQYGASAIATQMTEWQGESYQILGAVIITRADRDDINDLDDLIGRSFATTVEDSFGWRMVQREMVNEGIDPHTDLELELGYSYNEIVDAVINGDVDAGSLRSGVLEQMTTEGTLDIDDIKGIHLYNKAMDADDDGSDHQFHIVGGQVVKNVPFIHSTSIYPEWAFARLPSTPVDLAGHVALALPTIHSSITTAQGEIYTGWGAPLSYQPVHECLQELQISPYEDHGEFSLIDAVSKYWYVPLTLIFIILLNMLYSSRVMNVNRKLESEISNRKQAETMLENERQQLISMFDSMDEMVYVADPENYELVYMNGPVQKDGGGKNGQKCYSVLHGLDAPCPFCTNDRIFGEHLGTTYAWDFQNTLNHRWYSCIDRAIMWSDGRMVRFEMAIDITGRKQTEDALRESEARFRKSDTKNRTILDVLPDMIFQYRRDGTIYDYHNAKDERLFVPSSMFLGKNVTEVLPKEVASQIMYSTDQVFQTNELQTFQYKLPIADNIYDFEARIIAAGENEALAIVADITPRKQVEEAMIHAKLAAEDASRTKSEFLANMSHELRTPLNSVIGFSDVLLDETFGPLNEKQSKYISNVLGSGKHLLDLINDILDISKLEAGEMELQCEDVSVLEMIAETLSTLAPMASKKDVIMDVDIDPQLSVIYADRSKFMQILSNLVNNAIKFTPGPGRVTILGCITGDVAQLSVSDTGIGISEKDQGSLFDPFKQVDSAASREYQGTGLGLALVRQFVELHGGEVWVESEKGEGTTFTFTIPLKTDVSYT